MMKRRHFIQQTGVLSAAACLPLKFKPSGLNKSFLLGYQLFSIRDRMKDEPIETLRQLKSFGYQDFEVYGYDIDKDEFYGLPSARFKEVLNDLGLSVSSGHYLFAPYLDYTFSDLVDIIDQCISGAKTLNSQYITWPVIMEDQRTEKNIKKLPELLNRIGERVTKAGLGFAYHNHGYEFDQYGDVSGYDLILKETNHETVKLQMDMYWVMHAAKTTPQSLVREHPGRFVMWHIKDMDPLTRDYTELGQGALNYLNILPPADESGLEYLYIEQGGNYAVDSLESARVSAEYYSKFLQRKINSNS